MKESFEQRYEILNEWVKSASQAGWIPAEELDRLERIERQQAEALFAQRGERPLIVAFFGGTGVGKSSLLNRLAGGEIARVGVERPTSHEVTLYLHHDYQLAELPAELPLEETLVAYHDDDNRRLIAWLDLPDIDSVEQHHRALVQAWLPYVDWLVYVVSPERYQDDTGWRFVQQRGARHAWLFVMNQWDQGVQEQVDDFRDRLQREGVADPVILRTSCSTDLPDDDFGQLEVTINQAIQAYGLEVLQRFGLQTRFHELYLVGEQQQKRLSGFPLDGLKSGWETLCSHRLSEIEDELQTNRRLFVQGLNPQEDIPWYRFWSKPSESAPRPQPAQLLDEVWSGRIGRQLEDVVPEVENLLRSLNVPVEPFTKGLDSVCAEGRSLFAHSAEAPLARALALPGSRLQRGLYAATGWLGWGLPLGITGWVVYHVVSSFYAGTQGEAEFLGIDFMLHSGLMIGLSWLLPWLLQRRLRPTLAQALDSGLEAGIRSGLRSLQRAADGVRMSAADDLAQRLSTLSSIQDELSPEQPASPAAAMDQWAFKSS